ncbi:hypothetical protein GCM10011514_35680 [Emticicia aquatilis]|uniref:Uncharacterized protein n=1 Tax=Emticicia aquatilis TaxID=1537369 RepID=A0A916YZA3_9BACT|nr:hypothetical protein [Emticicia aquatilis]GGD68443.1 hypothetical protein GCM10011514_35680 [Emticicia aquatilis]
MITLEQRQNFYKELFYKEVDRRKDFNNSIVVPITLLTGVFSIIFYLISAYKFINWVFIDYCFIVLFSFSTIFFIICAYYTVKFYSNIDSGFKTIELPRPDEIEEYRKELWLFHDKADVANEAFNTWLIEQYITATVNYQTNNDLKSTHFFHFKKYFFYGLIGLFMCGIFFITNILLNKSEKEDKINFHIELNLSNPKDKYNIIDTTVFIKKDSLKIDVIKPTLKDK